MDKLLARRVDTEQRLARARGDSEGLENEYREKDRERKQPSRHRSAL